MSYKISKKLFEAVMSVGLYDELYIDNYFDEYNGVEIEDWQIIKYNNTWIPLDTFVFKCKEWALKQEYNIWSDCIGNITIQDENFDTVDASISNKSEQQAVFDACQWILDNKDKQ